MIQKAKRCSFLLYLALLVLAAGCQPVVSSPAPVATQPPVQEIVVTLLPATAAQPAVIQPTAGEWLANCPVEEAGRNLYVSEINGFCFLYPDGFVIQPDELRPDEVVKLVGPREEAGSKQMEVATVLVWLASNGPADAATSVEYAQKWRDLYISPLDPAEITSSETEMGGHPAVVLDSLPGMILQKSGFVVANGYKYSLTVSPAPGFVSELDEPAGQAWAMITETVYFFPPLVERETVLASQACPPPAAGTKLLVREAEGYCFLYPDDFQINQAFGGRVEGGPDLGNWEGFGHVHVSLMLGAYPVLAGDLAQTPREHAAGIAGVDPNTIQERTIGGALAVVFKTDPPAGPWAARQAYILTDQSRVYTIVNDPWEPERWPESTGPFERVWETVTESLTFFTPWN